MKRYYLFNFSETEELYIGDFQNDIDFWKYYRDNETKITEKTNRMDRYCKSWHMSSF